MSAAAIEAAPSAAKPSSRQRLSHDDRAFETSAAAFEAARHRWRYRHCSAVVYKDRDGMWHEAPYGATSLKAAMLAVGTSGYFNVIEARHGRLVRWREAVIRRCNAPHYYSDFA